MIEKNDVILIYDIIFTFTNRPTTKLTSLRIKFDASKQVGLNFQHNRKQTRYVAYYTRDFYIFNF
jgi:hypothetical protein